MHEHLDRLVRIGAGTLLALITLSASATSRDLDAQWARYAQQQTMAEPAYTFPHATCFKAAALQYDLPETLLLAVARGESDFEPTARSRAPTSRSISIDGNCPPRP